GRSAPPAPLLPQRKRARRIRCRSPPRSPASSRRGGLPELVSELRSNRFGGLTVRSAPWPAAPQRRGEGNSQESSLVVANSIDHDCVRARTGGRNLAARIQDRRLQEFRRHPFADLPEVSVRQVRISGGHLRRAMAQYLLDFTQRRSAHREVGRGGMPEIMKAEVFDASVAERCLPGRPGKVWSTGIGHENEVLLALFARSEVLQTLGQRPDD